MINSKMEEEHTTQNYLAFKPLPNMTPDDLSFLMSALLYNSIELRYRGPMRCTCDVVERDIAGSLRTVTFYTIPWFLFQCERKTICVILGKSCFSQDL